MGTSVNQRSSNKGAWAAQHAVLGNQLVPIKRQLSEIWRAALGDREGSLQSELAAPEIHAAALICSKPSSAVVASESFERVLEKSDPGTIAVEFAKRSLIRATSHNLGAEGFGADLIAEAISYIVARDLPSYVGATGRIETSAQAIELKEAARISARSAAIQVASGLPAASLTTPKGWKSFIKKTVNVLAGDYQP